MPIAKVQLPDGSVGRFEVPEGASEQDAIAYAQKWWTEEGQQQAAPVAPSRSTVDELGRQVGLTGRAITTGVADVAGIATNPIMVALNSVLPADWQGDPSLSNAVGTILTRLGVPEPETAIERGVQQVSRGAVGAMATMGAAGAIAPTLSGAVAPAMAEMAAAPAAQVGGAIGAELGTQAAEAAGAGPAVQFGAGLAGALAGGKVGNVAETATRAIPATAAQQAVQTAEPTGIRVLTSDVAAPGTFVSKTIQGMGEKIPFGTGAARQAQQAERVQAIKNLMDEYGAVPSADIPERIYSDLAAKHKGMVDRYATQKKEVIDRLTEKGAVPTPGASTVIDEEIARLSKNIDNPEVEKIVIDLQQMKKGLQNKDLSALEVERKLLGEKYQAPEAADIRALAKQSTGKIYNALRNDMGDFIAANGERRDFNKWMVANKRLAEEIKNIENTSLRTILNKGEATPELVNRMLFSAKPSEVKDLFRHLTPDGREYARTSIIARTIEKAGGPEAISPERFANEVKRLGNSVGVFFDKDAAQRLDGLVKTINITRRAGTASVAPPTGVQAVPYAIGGLFTYLFGPVGAVAAAGSVAGGTRAYESKPVRDLLLKLGQAKAGSAEEAALGKRIISTIQAQTNEEPK